MKVEMIARSIWYSNELVIFFMVRQTKKRIQYYCKLNYSKHLAFFRNGTTIYILCSSNQRV
jgi:hypothetical protein